MEAKQMEQAIEQFEQYIKSRYPDSTTARHYVHDLRQFSQLIGKSPRAVTQEDVDQFVEDQLERGLAATTVNRRLAAVHEFFEYLAEKDQEEEWLNPMSWRRHRVKAGQPLPRDVSEAEVERLFEQITHSRDKAMFRLMLDVGLRVEEVARLQVNDLMVTSEGSLGRLRVLGKGSKERFVWLMPETLEVVQTWLVQRPQVSDERMFITRRKKGFSVRGIQERLAHYGRLAGVKVSPHQLRHTFGRRMAEAEMPVTSLATLMGHAQVTTTQIYIAGAGVEVQADYQAAIARLKAARRESPSVWDNQPERGDEATESTDVWTLVGVELQPDPAPQATPGEELDLSRYWEGLPDWLTSLLQPYIVYRQYRWKSSQVRCLTRVQLRTLRRVWRRLLREGQIDSLADLKRSHVQGFVDSRLADGLSSGSVNAELTALWAFLRYLEERSHPVRPSVFRVKRPKRGEPLPRFLSESDYQRLESQVLQDTQAGERDDLLNRAWFYLLSEAGLRISEVCDLRLGDVDLIGRRLVVRHGKSDRDRTVPLSPNLLTVLKTYLPVRGKAQTDHLLIYREQSINPSLIDGRLRRYGRQAQVQVSAHRLRHTLATRLLNEGMPITSLQRLLGHKTLNTTLLYARVHNETVRRDYEHAHARLMPASLLADEFFGAPVKEAEPQPITA
jgi:site-specific recombinase XerD